MPAPLAATIAPLLRDHTTLKVAVDIADAGPITIRQMDAVATAGRVSVTGTVNTVGNRIDLAYKVQAGTWTADFAALLPPDTGWDSLSVEGTAKSALDAPEATASIHGAGLRQGLYGAGTLAFDLTATPQGPLSRPDRAPIALPAPPAPPDRHRARRPASCRKRPARTT